jgi:hypothetical protein
MKKVELIRSIQAITSADVETLGAVVPTIYTVGPNNSLLVIPVLDETGRRALELLHCLRAINEHVIYVAAAVKGSSRDSNAEQVVVLLYFTRPVLAEMWQAPFLEEGGGSLGAWKKICDPQINEGIGMSPGAYN